MATARKILKLQRPFPMRRGGELPRENDLRVRVAKRYGRDGERPKEDAGDKGEKT
jgi:hypothetical protein